MTANPRYTAARRFALRFTMDEAFVIDVPFARPRDSSTKVGKGKTEVTRWSLGGSLIL
jgi:hypothetical protein